MKLSIMQPYFFLYNGYRLHVHSGLALERGEIEKIVSPVAIAGE